MTILVDDDLAEWRAFVAANPQPSAPAHHVEVPGAPYSLCPYGSNSWDADGKLYWCACDCEDPARPWLARRPTDGPRDCECALCAGKVRSERGRAPCEAENHHCEYCHESGRCTTLECLAERARDRVR